MRVSVIDPWHVLYEGNAEEVLLPGDDGELCVLDFHHPFLYRLRKGAVQILKSRTRDATPVPPRAQVEARIPIHDGVARMAGNELVILVDTTTRV
jgi:F0F1-type ATP synthase epsilon subunit